MYQIQMFRPERGETPDIIYDQNDRNQKLIIGPRAAIELSEAGNLSFVVLPGHPLYNEIKPLSCFIKALDDGDEIFYGRILHRSDPTLTGQVTIQCEGALSFLLDSEVEPDATDNKGNPQTRTLTAEQFFRWCIDQHNAEVNDPRRMFTVGEIATEKQDETREYPINSYTQTKSAIDSNILDYYGGYIRIRPIEGSVFGHYIDWIQMYPSIDNETIQIGENVEDQTNELDANNLFTVLRPVGKKDNEYFYLTEKTIPIYDTTQLNEYGRIVKTIEFPEATNEDELRVAAQDYIDSMYKTLFISSSIRLVDMHYIDGGYPKLRLGNAFNNIRGLEGTIMICSSMDIDFESVQNTSINLVNHKTLIPDRSPNGNGYNNGGSKSLSRSSRKASSTALKHFQDIGDNALIEAKQLDVRVEDLNINVTNRFRETAAEFERISSRVTDVSELANSHTRRLNGIDYQVDVINATDVIQNSTAIWNIAGEFDVFRGQDGNVKAVVLKKGTEFQIDDANGSTTTVGEALSEYKIDHGVIHNQILGSALWTQRDNITGVCGEYEVQIDPSTGKKTLIIKSGGGIKVRRDNAEFGLYDSGSLTAGIIVDKINGGTTKITGNRVTIDGQTTIHDVMTIDGNYVSIKKPMLISGGGSTTIISSTAVSADQVAVRSSLVFGSEGSSDQTITYSILSSMIKTAAKSGNTLTLTRFDGTTLDFSSATTLTGAWDSGTYTVTASPQGSTRETTLQLITPVPNSTISRSGKNVSRQFRVRYGPNEDNLNDTGFVQTISIDASSVYNYGKSGVTLTDPVWNSISGAVPSSRTVTVSTSGRVNIYGTTDNLPKSVSLFLVKSGLTVYMRTESTSGTTYAQTTCSDSNLVAGNIKNGVTIFGVTGSFQGSKTIKRIDLDSGMNHVGNWWNYVVTYTDGTTQTGITDQSTTGLYMSIPNIEFTSNGVYNARDAGHAGYQIVTVNVSGGSSGPTKHDAFVVTVTPGPSGNVVTIQKTYPNGSACPFTNTSSKNFYWY